MPDDEIHSPQEVEPQLDIETVMDIAYGKVVSVSRKDLGVVMEQIFGGNTQAVLEIIDHIAYRTMQENYRENWRSRVFGYPFMVLLSLSTAEPTMYAQVFGEDGRVGLHVHSPTARTTGGKEPWFLAIWEARQGQQPDTGFAHDPENQMYCIRAVTAQEAELVQMIQGE